jgi:hypothetical protein
VEDEKPLGPVINDLRQQLAKDEAKDTQDSLLGLIIALLDRVNRIYRRPIMHPEMILDGEEARKVFQVAAEAISTMADDLAERGLLRELGNG